MSIESNECPVWAKTLIEGMMTVNNALADSIKGLQERQNAIEARFDGKEPEKPEKSKAIDPKNPVFDKIFESLNI
jgi:hypothetical protein